MIGKFIINGIDMFSKCSIATKFLKYTGNVNYIFFRKAIGNSINCTTFIMHVKLRNQLNCVKKFINLIMI